MTLDEFIEKVGRSAQKYYSQYRILPSLCIAQALLESNKGNYKNGVLNLSGLATECHNYFGMKWTEGCGCDYKEYKTKEQRKDGSYYEITARFRKYPDIDSGIRGYFDFLQYPRYANLKGVTSYQDACNLIRADGWATSLTYTENLIARIEYLQLYRFDPPFAETNELCYPAYRGSSNSIVMALEDLGIDSSFAHREKIYNANFYGKYSGQAAQNLVMLSWLKNGKLKKV